MIAFFAVALVVGIAVALFAGFFVGSSSNDSPVNDGSLNSDAEVDDEADGDFGEFTREEMDYWYLNQYTDEDDE